MQSARAALVAGLRGPKVAPQQVQVLAQSQTRLEQALA
jgi:hypothetical protein